mgnify:CR=1 FL=1
MYYPIIKKNKFINFNLMYVFIFAFLARWFFLFPWFFIIEGHASGDVRSYELHIQWVIEGLVPNKDFGTPYGFYFYYFLSIPYKLFSHPAMIIFTLHLCEIFGVILFYSAIKKLINIKNARIFVLLYFFNPLIITWFAFDGQDEALLILSFGALFWGCANASRFMKVFFSGFSIFVAKLTSLAAIVPLFLKINLREKILIILTILLFLLVPLTLNSEIFSLSFDRYGGSDNLTNTIFPGNIWFLINQFTSNDPGYILNNKIIIFLSRLFLISLSLVSFIIILKLSSKTNEANYLAYGVVLFTLSFQISSYYTSPGFLATIVPFLIYLLLLNFEIIRINTNIILLYFLILPFDIHIYLRMIEHIDNTIGYISVLFYVYELIIVLANIFVFCFVVRYLLNKNFKEDV